MKTKTVTLKDGPVACELSPLEDEEGFDRARIVGGEFGKEGDILFKPADLTWEEAMEEIAPGRTALSPFDLELVQDIVTQFSYFPEGGLEALCELSDGVAEGARTNEADDEDYREALARLLAQLTELAVPKADSRLRRRQGEAA